MVKFDFTGQNLIVGIYRGETPLVSLVHLDCRIIGKYIVIIIYPLQYTVCRMNGAACQRQSCVCQGHTACGNLMILRFTACSSLGNHNDKRCTGDLTVIAITCLGCCDNNASDLNRSQNAILINRRIACASYFIHFVSNLACSGAADRAQLLLLSIDHSVVTGDAQCLLRVFRRQFQYQILGKVFIIWIGNRYRPTDGVIFRTGCQPVGDLSGCINHNRFHLCRSRSLCLGNAVCPCLPGRKSCVIGCEGLLLPVGEFLL